MLGSLEKSETLNKSKRLKKQESQDPWQKKEVLLRFRCQMFHHLGFQAIEKLELRPLALKFCLLLLIEKKKGARER